MKKILTVLAGMFALVVVYGGVVFWLASANVVAADPKVRLYLTPTSPSVEAGSTTSMQIRLSKNTNSKVDYVNASLTFSAGYLEALSVSKQGSHFGASGGPTTSFNNTNGTISVKGSGAELPMTADVLVATITFRGESVGTTSIGFAAASVAGDITNGGHVKNALDMKTGATITVSSVAPPEDSGSEGSDGVDDEGSENAEETVEEELTPEEEQEPEASSGESAESSGSTSDDDSSSSQPTRTAGNEAAVATEPWWKKYLWPIVGTSVLVLGMGAMGIVAALKRRSPGGPSVELPSLSPAVTEDPATEENVGVSELAEAEEVVVEGPLAVEQSVEVPAAQDATEAPGAQVAAPQAIDTPPPAEVAPPLQPVSPPPPQVVTPPVVAPLPPVAHTLAPAPQRVATPRVAPAPLASAPQPPVVVAPQATSHNTTDYANLPDMFDVGEQRLRDEGLDAMKPTSVPK